MLPRQDISAAILAPVPITPFHSNGDCASMVRLLSFGTTTVLRTVLERIIKPVGGQVLSLFYWPNATFLIVNDSLHVRSDSHSTGDSLKTY